MADNKGKNIPSNANFAVTLEAVLKNIEYSERIIKVILDSTAFLDNTNLDALKERGKKFGEVSKLLKLILDNMKNLLET